jgi:hypothetical protein
MGFRFIFTSFLILVTLIVLMQFTYTFFSNRILPHWAFHFLFGWLFAATLGGTWIIERKMKNRPKQFINAFMGVSSIRMFVAVLIVVFLVLKTGKDAKFLAIFFVFGYLCFLVMEVMYLFKRSKVNGRQRQ